MVPILRADKIVAILGVGNKPTDYTEADVRLVNYFADVAWEIAERQRAEAALRDNESRFRFFIEQAPVAIGVFDLAGHGLYANRAFLEALGLQSLEEMIGRPAFEYFAPRFQEESKERTRRRLQGLPVPAEYESVALRAGEEFPVHMAVAPIQLADKTVSIAFLTDITDRKRAEEQIKKNLAEKEALLRELYHRTKNNMQVIISMLQFQAASIQDPYILGVFRDAQNRIRAMAKVHQMLYSAQDLSSVNLQYYVSDLAESLLKSHQVLPGQIQLVLDAQDITVLFDIAIPCGLILNELLSNALRHAFPNGRAGEIHIQLYRASADELVLCVADNGVGAPPGFDFRACDSMGLQMVLATAEQQLQGRVEFQTGAGVTCCVHFKDNVYMRRV
jgi:PAS domain S-box-containing protein